MKYFNLITILATVLFSMNTVSAQITCDSIASVTNSYLSTSKDAEIGRYFISDGQVYRAFLDEDQTAEFEVTFYGNSTYRISASAGIEDNFVVYEIYDQDRNLLFSNYDYNNAPYWDFVVENTIDCTIELRLDLNKKLSGCVRMMIGFQKIITQ